jgi:methionyl-tRNA formyltransferase
VWNIHASLLPKYRGASPIQSAILAGEAYSGITVMKTALALDSGDILLVKRLPLAEMDCTEAQPALAKLGGEAALDALALLTQAEQKAETITDYFLSLNLLVQDEAQVTYCKKITREDAKIDWNQSAQEVVQKVRAFVEEPVAWCLKDGQAFNIYKAQAIEDSKAQTAVNQEEGKAQPQEDRRAGQVLSADKKGIIVACGSGSVRILSAQLAGGKILSAADLVNGRKIKSGDCLE